MEDSLKAVFNKSLWNGLKHKTKNGFQIHNTILLNFSQTNQWY